MNQDDEHRENGSSKRHMFCSTERVFMAAAPGEQTSGYLRVGPQRRFSPCLFLLLLREAGADNDRSIFG